MEATEKVLPKSRSRNVENKPFFSMTSFSRAGVIWFSFALITLGLSSALLFVVILSSNISLNAGYSTITSDILGIASSAAFISTGLILVLSLKEEASFRVLRNLGLTVSIFFVLASVGTFYTVSNVLDNLQWIFYLVGGFAILSVSLLAETHFKTYPPILSAVFIGGIIILSIGASFVTSGFNLISSADPSAANAFQQLTSNPFFFLSYFGVYGSSILFFAAAMTLVALSAVIYINEVKKPHPAFGIGNFLFSAGIVIFSAGMVFSVYNAFSSNFLSVLYQIYLTGNGIAWLVVAAEFLVAIAEFVFVAAAIALVLYAII